MKNWLDKLEWLEQEKTPINPRINNLGPVKAILWDIYGTLMISASGDIDKARFSREVILESLRDCEVSIPSQSEQTVAEEIMALFPVQVKEFHQKEKAGGNPYPEVDIIDIWQKTLQPFINKKIFTLPEKPDFRTLAFRFELGFNRLGPMLGLKKNLESLSRKIPMGIISNAQFYTPIILNYLLSGECINSATIKYFQPDLCIYSYQYGKAKPGLFLYEKAKEVLGQRGISAAETLYVGNDMLNDIWPARQVGFKTILYAGDKRSLRLREDRPDIKDLKPDGIITEVGQIAEFFKD
ncbi:MAG: HAD family hydrolase [Spirochaetales bacterium]|nr:HAD family hydrolase [Spirochaetales bacterium]